MGVTSVITLLLVSMYAPTIGGINCDDDCGFMATNIPPFEGAAACPYWMPLWTTTITLEYSPDGLTETFVCMDRGGMVTKNKIDLCITEDDVSARAVEWGRRPVIATVEFGVMYDREASEDRTRETISVYDISDKADRIMGRDKKGRRPIALERTSPDAIRRAIRKSKGYVQDIRVQHTRRPLGSYGGSRY